MMILIPPSPSQFNKFLYESSLLWSDVDSCSYVKVTGIF